MSGLFYKLLIQLLVNEKCTQKYSLRNSKLKDHYGNLNTENNFIIDLNEGVKMSGGGGVQSVQDKANYCSNYSVSHKTRRIP